MSCLLSYLLFEMFKNSTKIFLPKFPSVIYSSWPFNLSGEAQDYIKSTILYTIWYFKKTCFPDVVDWLLYYDKHLFYEDWQTCTFILVIYPCISCKVTINFSTLIWIWFNIEVNEHLKNPHNLVVSFPRKSHKNFGFEIHHNQIKSNCLFYWLWFSNIWT